MDFKASRLLGNFVLMYLTRLCVNVSNVAIFSDFPFVLVIQVFISNDVTNIIRTPYFSSHLFTNKFYGQRSLNEEKRYTPMILKKRYMYRKNASLENLTFWNAVHISFLKIIEL